jgi:formylglycine-generating enzyme required for sulfatase activity
MLMKTLGRMILLAAVWAGCAARVPAQTGGNGSLYMVVDLAGGTNAATYPVTYLSAAPAGGWTDAHKTSKLVMRRIDPGTFNMGSPTNELGRATNEVLHAVTLTQGYYLGVFEVTQRQWELVMGNRPSYFNNAAHYASRPVESVSYTAVRGAVAGQGWPWDSAVDASSFMGKMREKTGLTTFDLPTEAQWEYACRAGTATALNSGRNLTNRLVDANLALVGRYGNNGGFAETETATGTTSVATAKVGSYRPNAWGLFDMHGDICEWCLDWLGPYPATPYNPKGALAGEKRVLRGGGIWFTADLCRAANRDSYTPLGRSADVGFRAASAVSYNLRVVGGMGEGVYAKGADVGITAGVPPAGKVFDHWTVTPATANLVEILDARAESTSLFMPAANVTLTAVFIPIPKLTVVGGVIAGLGTNQALVLPNAYRVISANGAAGKVFEKWTVMPPTASLGDAFNPRQDPMELRMPSVNVTLTAVYVATPGKITVPVLGSLPEEPVYDVFWSIDNATWVPVNEDNPYPLKPGRYTVNFKSTTLRWLAPAARAATIISNQTTTVAAVATYVPFVKWSMSPDSAPGGGAVALSPATGQVLPGRSVTLTARPAKDFVFVEWKGLGGMPPGSERNPSLTVAPANDMIYKARFRAKSDCTLPEVWINTPTTCMVGVAYSTLIAVDNEAMPVTFSATPLPAGLRLDPVTGLISGVPTRPGTVNVTIRGTNVKGAAPPRVYAFTVAPLQPWAQGTFDGVTYLRFFDPKTGGFPGTASMSVTAQGRITGKLACGGTNYTFSAASYVPPAEGFDTLSFEAEAKGAGTYKMLIGFTVQPIPPRDESLPNPAPFGMVNGAYEGTISDCQVHLDRNVWRDPGMTAEATNFTGYYTATLPGGTGYGSGYLTLTVDRTGGVKTTGKLADGTVVSLSGSLIKENYGQVRTVLYVAPAAYRGGSLFGVVEIDRVDGGAPFLRLWEGKWESRDPQATGTYGAGFSRDLALTGGWYDRLINLRAYYVNGLTVYGAALPELKASVRHTFWSTDPVYEPETHKITMTYVDIPIDAAAGAAQPYGLALGVTPLTPLTSVGTGLAAPRVDTPTRSGMTGPYNYAVDTPADGQTNTCGLTFNFARATGLFSGSFKAWYDYASVLDETTGTELWTHTYKTMSFEGVLTPVREEGEAEGRGFFLSPDRGWRDSGRDDAEGNPILTPYTFNRSFDFLLNKR